MADREPSLAARSPEPKCCGEPMIHNSFTSEYECSVAYFALSDEDGDLPDRDTLTTDYEREQYAHWRSSKVADRVS